MPVTCVNECVTEYVNLWNKKDVNTLVEKFYRDSSKLLPPDGSLIKGKAGILKFMQDAIAKSGTTKCQWVIEEVFGSDDVATSVGSYTLSNEQGTIVKCGKSVVVWKQGSDGCKLEVDAYTEKPQTKGCCQ